MGYTGAGFEAILGDLGDFGPFLGHFGSFWALLGPFWALFQWVCVGLSGFEWVVEWRPSLVTEPYPPLAKAEPALPPLWLRLSRTKSALGTLANGKPFRLL